MKNITKKLLCLLFVSVMILSLAVSGIRVNADGIVVTDEEIPADRVLYTFTADDFRLPYSPDNGDGVFEDADSSTGKAAVLSYAKRLELGDKGMVNAMLRTGTQTLAIYSQGDPYVLVGEISIAQLRENSNKGGYTTYAFYNIDLMPAEGDYFIYIFDCWGFQVRFTDEQKANLRGKFVDFYLSLKVTGDVANSEDNTPTYYIDKITIAESDPNAVHRHTFGPWAVDSEIHRRACSECGEMESGSHEWDEGVVTKEATETEDGTKTYTCTACGKTKNIVMSKLGGGAPNTNQGGSTANANPTGLIIAIVMIVLALGIVVVAVVLLKPKKQ